MFANCFLSNTNYFTVYITKKDRYKVSLGIININFRESKNSVCLILSAHLCDSLPHSLSFAFLPLLYSHDKWPSLLVFTVPSFPRHYELSSPASDPISALEKLRRGFSAGLHRESLSYKKQSTKQT